MSTTITGLKCVDYEVIGNGIKLHFTISAGGSGGMVSEYYINLTDVEINSARDINQLKIIIQRKLDRLFNGAGVGILLDLLPGTIFAPGIPARVPPYFEDNFLGAQIVITPLSINSLGVEIGAVNSATPVSTAWGTDNLSVGVPFVIAKPLVVQKLFWYNGAVVSGNIACGIYSEDGNLLMSVNSIIQANANKIQEVIVPNILLGCGRYYMILVSDSALSTFFASNLGIQLCKVFGCIQNTLLSPLPTTIIPEAYNSVFIPIFGLSSRALVV